MKYRANNPAEPLLPHPVPERPYQKVGGDLFVCDGKDYIVVTDSLYPEVCKLQTITAEAVILSMKAIFSRHGVPNEVFTDNGPQFVNMSFKCFAEEWNFIHTTSSPHFPQSNGLVEKSVQTVKRLMYKAKDSGADFYQSLLVYRSTPLECGRSPAHLLMGRRLRSNLPILLKMQEGEVKRIYKEQQKAKQKFYYDRGTQILPELHTGDQVRIKDKTDTGKQKATVLCKVQPRSYAIRTEEQTAVLRRNRRDLMGPAAAVEKADATEQPEVSAQGLEPTLRRSSRHARPPERPTEQI